MNARRASLLLALSGLLVGACAPSNNLNIGLKDYATDVVYGGSATTAPELPPPFPGASLTPGFPSFLVPPPLPSSFTPPRLVEFIPDPCPIADSKSRVIPAVQRIVGLPGNGRYSYKQAGSSKTGAAAPVALPVLTERTIKNAKLIDGEATWDVEIVEFGRTTVTSYRVRRPSGQSSAQSPADGLYITHVLQTEAGKDPQEFLPLPPGLRIFAEPAAAGTPFVSAASDPSHGTGMALQGTIRETRKIDVCGVFVDTWVTDATITVRRSGAPAAKPNDSDDFTITASYAVSTALGGIIIANSVTQTGTDQGVVRERSTNSQLVDLAPH